MKLNPYLVNAADKAFRAAVSDGMSNGHDGLDVAVWLAEALKARAATEFAQRGECFGSYCAEVKDDDA